METSRDGILGKEVCKEKRHIFENWKMRLCKLEPFMENGTTRERILENRNAMRRSFLEKENIKRHDFLEVKYQEKIGFIEI